MSVVLIITAFAGVADLADGVTASGARLSGRATCEEAACDVVLEWGPCALSGVELVCTYQDRMRWDGVAGAMEIAHQADGLEPGRRYRFRVCGKPAGRPDEELVCGAERDFDTGVDRGAPPSPRVRAGSIARAGSLSHAQGSHQGRDVGAAIELGGRLLWFFGDTALTVTAADGSNWRTSTAAHGPTGPLEGDYPPLDDAAAPSEHLDGNGAPAQFVPYTAAEPELVDAGGETLHYYHWPIYGFTRAAGGGEEALVFFSRGVFFGDAPSATYVDIVRDGGVQTSGAADRRLLWNPAVAEVDRYFPIDVEESGFRYFVAGKRSNGGYTSRLFLARVPPEEATDPAAYRYWNPATGEWQAEQVSPPCGPDACTAEGIIEVSAFADYHTSISWNPYLEKYLLVAGNGLGAALHVADALTGPWSAGTVLPATDDGAYGFLTPTATQGLPNYHARETVQLRSADGRTVVLSYLHAVDEGPGDRAVKLFRLTMERPAGDGEGDGEDGEDDAPGDDEDDLVAGCGCGASASGRGLPAALALALMAIGFARGSAPAAARAARRPR
jgi:hypothetical protein